MIRNFDKLRHDGFARAIKKNVVKEPSWRARLNNRFIQWALSQPLEKPTVPARQLYELPELNPRTLHYWQNRPILYSAPAGTDPWLIELARVVIPSENIGILKSLEQVVVHPDLQNPNYFSISGQWGNPFPFPAGLIITWHLRLERVTGTEPALINQSGVGVQALLPGEPHFELPEFDNLWFPASSPASQNIHLTIGGRYRLRVLALVERADEYDLSIACKIRGFRLSPYDKFTLFPLRALW